MNSPYAKNLLSGRYELAAGNGKFHQKKFKETENSHPTEHISNPNDVPFIDLKPKEDIMYMHLLQTYPLVITETPTNGEVVLEKVNEDMYDGEKGYITIDFRMAEGEIETFKKESVFWFDQSKYKDRISTFGEFYMRMFRQEIPVFISSDAVLHAFHSSFDNIQYDIESNYLFLQLAKLVNAMWSNATQYEKTLIKDSNEERTLLPVKVLILVGYLLLTDKLDHNSPVWSTLSAFVHNEIDNSTVKVKDLEKNTFKPQNGRPKSPNRISIGNTFPSSTTSPRNDEMKSVGIDLDSHLPQSYSSLEETVFYAAKIVNKVRERKVGHIKFLKKEKKIDFSLFDPCFHYGKTQILQNYFKTMMWFSAVSYSCMHEIDFIWAVTFILHYTQESTTLLNDFTKVFDLIMGESDGYNPVEIKSVANDLGLKGITIGHPFKENLMTELAKMRKTISSNQDLVNGPFNNYFAILPQRLFRDNKVLGAIVYPEVLDEKTQKPVNRRQLHPLDIVYTLFHNDSAKEILYKRMQPNCEKKVQWRDGFDYSNNLEEAKEIIKQSMIDEPDKWRMNVYHHWLLLLSKLSGPSGSQKPSQNKEKTNFSAYYKEDDKIDETVVFMDKDAITKGQNGKAKPQKFTQTKAWEQKTLLTQLAAFSELKHDPKISLNQDVNPGEGCGIPDLYVEPNPQFWEEFLRLIDKLKTVLGPCQESVKAYFEDFSISLKLLLKFVLCSVDEVQPPAHIVTQLKNVVYHVENEEYGPMYDGWYMRMYYNHSDFQLLKEWKPEIADINEDPDEPKIENKGSIVHIGTTGRPRVSAVLVEDAEGKKVFLMPSYDVRAVTTNYPVVLDDEKWKMFLSKNYAIGAIQLDA